MGSHDVVRELNQKIREFVESPENSRLQRGTGSYSTPFRGELFGLSDSLAIANELLTRSVDILWLGSNPNVPQSISQIIDPLGKSDYPDFLRQLESGYFSSWRWDPDGVASSDWNPIQRRERNWAIYRDAFSEVADIDAVTMANFLPWGARTLEDFAVQLGAVEPDLLRRALAFSNEMTRFMVEALSPKLLIVPLSLGRSSNLEAFGPVVVSMRKTQNLSQQQLNMGRSGTFNLFTGSDLLGVPVVFLRNPSSLQLNVEDRAILIDQLSHALSRML